MPPPDPAAALRDALQEVTRNLVERETLVELIALAAVAGEHVLIIGPPGTAKSVAVRRMANSIGGQYFEYLLGRFTEPSEIFGPVDLRELRNGVVKVDCSGMLPEAEIAFLDEVFLGSSAILNTLLGILNERTYRRGSTQLQCPLRVCVGASNSLPDDPALEAFADRFLIRSFVSPVRDSQLEVLLESGDALAKETFSHRTTLGTLDQLIENAKAVDALPVRTSLAQALRELRHAGVSLSDRRAVKLQKLVCAATAIAGRSTATTADLWPLVFTMPTPAEQEIAREILHKILGDSENASLPAAVAAASSNPAARAGLLIAEAQARLSEKPTDADEESTRAWALQLEGLLREIDAGFDVAALPEELATHRTQMMEAVKVTLSNASINSAMDAVSPDAY